MKLKELTIFDQDAPEIDSIFDQEGDRWSITLYNGEDEVDDIEDFREKGIKAIFDNIEYGQRFIIQADDEVMVDNFGYLMLEDEENDFRLEFLEFAPRINLIPQTK